ncbi:MAG TPA: NTP transferase domain-containing protein [Candidatus Thermoplasmatota archaeon]|nr:NTP transferase domain-containing protein [Candidatus Thermoplasmatota archaeon]
MKVASIVLAAGASRRMGSPKALLDFGGERALARVVRIARATGADPVVVVLATDTLPIVSAALPDLPATLVENPATGAGRTGSLLRGLAVAPAGPVFVHPVDHPLVRASTLDALVVGLGTHEVARPVHAGARGHPILLSASAANAARRLHPATPLKELVGALDAVDVEVDDPGVLENIDTPEAYAKALERWNGERF